MANNGPPTGNNRRNRNTVRNFLSKYGMADEFPFKPSDTSAWAGRNAALKFQFRSQWATLAEEARAARSSARLAKVGIGFDESRGRGATLGQAMDRGVLGGRGNAAALDTVSAQADRARGEVGAELAEQMAAVNRQRMQAIANYRLGLAQTQLEKQGQAENMALQAFGSAGANPWGFPPGTGIGGPSPSTYGMTGPAPKNLNQIQDYARLAAAQNYGWKGPEWNALFQLVKNESGWNPGAQNPTSSAYGLFQFINSTWSNTGYQKSSDPRIQTQAGLKYISATYKTPSRALAFWNATVNKNPSLAPSDLRGKVMDWISRGYSGY